MKWHILFLQIRVEIIKESKAVSFHVCSKITIFATQLIESRK
jgi:hypothetical protein